jgi:two-component system, OmpR family, response regulator
MMSANILIVDDDPKVRTLLSSVLGRAGYIVTAAPDGETAIQLLNEQTFQLVLTDIRMRTVDGIQVLDAARNRPNRPVVILLTGYGSLETSLAALRAGAFDYLLKPCPSATLIDRVESGLRRYYEEHRQTEMLQTISEAVAQLQSLGTLPAMAREAGREPAPALPESGERYIQVGALNIDRYRHTVSFEGQPLHFTPIEFALLHCLAELQGRVVSYVDIVRRTHAQVLPEREAHSLLKVHIHNLRRKLAPGYIVSVRSTGYMLIDPNTNDQQHS